MSASAVLKLQKVGFTIEQVEALADFMDTQSASKADLEAAEHRLETKLLDTKAELKSDIASVKTDLLKTIIGAIAINSAVVIGAMFGLAKLLGH